MMARRCPTLVLLVPKLRGGENKRGCDMSRKFIEGIQGFGRLGLGAHGGSVVFDESVKAV